MTSREATRPVQCAGEQSMLLLRDELPLARILTKVLSVQGAVKVHKSKAREISLWQSCRP